MKDSRLQEIYERVQDAEMVLVGIGENFQYDWDALTNDDRYREIEEEIGNDEERVWIIPFLQKMVLRQEQENRWKLAYRNLNKIITGKNYFIVSLCMDDFVYGEEFAGNRVVTPCGGFRKMQCDNNCSHMLCDIPALNYDAVLQYYRKEKSIEDLQEPRCEACGAKLRFNQLGVKRYAEEGYLDQWNTYTKWLQGTVNKKLCVLELGVGMEYPTVLRFPLEKIIFYNQKAFLYRVHPALYQLGEEISGRGAGIQADPVAFLCEAEEKQHI